MELEHYGIKGMKWGRKKSDLKGQSFGETKVYETPAWLAANYQDLIDQYAGTMKRTLNEIQPPPNPVQSTRSSLGSVSDSLKRAKNTLRKIAGKPTANLKKETVSIGRGAIASISQMMAKKIKSK